MPFVDPVMNISLSQKYEDSLWNATTSSFWVRSTLAFLATKYSFCRSLLFGCQRPVWCTHYNYRWWTEKSLYLEAKVLWRLRIPLIWKENYLLGFYGYAGYFRSILSENRKCPNTKPHFLLKNCWRWAEKITLARREIILRAETALVRK